MEAVDDVKSRKERETDALPEHLESVLFVFERTERNLKGNAN